MASLSWAHPSEDIRILTIFAFRRFMKYLVIPILFVMLAGCTRNQSPELKALVNPDSKLGKVTEQLVKDELQRTSFNPFKYNVISLKKGSILCVNPGSFETEDSVLNCTAAEILTISDFIKFNISTCSNHQILESDGMIFLEFRNQQGEPVQLKRDSLVEVYLPSKGQKNGMGLFYNEFNGENNNWVPMTSANDGTVSCERNMWLVNDDSGYLKEFFKNVDTTNISTKLKKTFIYTEEFMTTFRKYVRTEGRITDEPNIYLNCALQNTNLYYADSLALDANIKLFTKFNPKYKDSSIAAIVETADWGTDIMMPLYSFFKEKWEKPIIINDHGVNLKLADARNQLIKKGVSPAEADQVLYLSRKREAFFENSKRGVRLYNKLKISKLGLNNVDRFFFEPSSIPSAIEVRIDGYNDNMNLQSYLVFHSTNTVIKGGIVRNGIISFLKDVKPYNKIPAKGNMSIFVIGVAGEDVYSASAVVKPASKINLNLKLEKTTVEAIERKMDMLDKNAMN